MTGGQGESLSNNLVPWDKCLVFPGVGENNPVGNLPCFCNDGPCSESAGGNSFLFSFNPDCDVETAGIDWVGFLESGCSSLESCSLTDTLDFEPKGERFKHFQCHFYNVKSNWGTWSADNGIFWWCVPSWGKMPCVLMSTNRHSGVALHKNVLLLLHSESWYLLIQKEHLLTFFFPLNIK